MNEDTHICGLCKSQFHTLKGFIEHKSVCVEPTTLQKETSFSDIKSESSIILRNNTEDSTSEQCELTNRDNGINTQSGAVLLSNASPHSHGSLLIRQGDKILTFQDIAKDLVLNQSIEDGSKTQVHQVLTSPTNELTITLPCNNIILPMGRGQSSLPNLPFEAVSDKESGTSDIMKADACVELDENTRAMECSAEGPLPEKVAEEDCLLEQPMDLSGNAEVALSEVSGNLKEMCGLDESIAALTEEAQTLQPGLQLATISPTLETEEPLKPINKLSPVKKNNKNGSGRPNPSTTAKEKSPKILTVTPKKFKCSRCEMVFAYRKDLERHFRVHTGDKPFGCQFCPKKFSRADKRKIHERMHTGDKPYKCTVCSYAATDNTNLKKHNLIHTNEKPYSCQICEYKCRNSNQLTVHIRTHTGDAPYVCYICKYAFKIKSDLTRHLFIHTGKKPYSCSHCDYKCSIKSNLKSHERINHNPGSMQVCRDCGFKTSSRKNYHQHMAIAHNALKCQRCNYVAKDVADQELHAKVHPGDKIYQCSMCSFSSDKSQTVKSHVLKKHPKQKKDEIWKPSLLVVYPPVKTKRQSPKEVDRRIKQLQAMCKKKFQCHKCDAAFVREDSLGCHLRNHDESEKLVAMAVLDLQNPVLVSGVVTADTNVTTSSMSVLGLQRPLIVPGVVPVGSNTTTSMSVLDLQRPLFVPAVTGDNTTPNVSVIDLQKTLLIPGVDTSDYNVSTNMSTLEVNRSMRPLVLPRVTNTKNVITRDNQTEQDPVDNQILNQDIYVSQETAANNNTISTAVHTLQNQQQQQQQQQQKKVATIIVNNRTRPVVSATTRTQDNTAQYSSAVLSRAASNLLAFMQNNQNKAVEENMSNMARQMEVDSVQQLSNSSSCSSRRVVVNRPTAQQLVVTSSLTTNIPTCQVINDNTASLNKQVQQTNCPTQETSVIDAIGNIEFNQASTSIISGNCNTHIDNTSAISTGQSNWEHLQRAVLQSVTLQADNMNESVCNSNDTSNVHSDNRDNCVYVNSFHGQDNSNLYDNNINSSINNSNNNVRHIDQSKERNMEHSQNSYVATPHQSMSIETTLVAQHSNSSIKDSHNNPTTTKVTLLSGQDTEMEASNFNDIS